MNWPWRCLPNYCLSPLDTESPKSITFSTSVLCPQREASGRIKIRIIISFPKSSCIFKITQPWWPARKVQCSSLLACAPSWHCPCCTLGKSHLLALWGGLLVQGLLPSTYAMCTLSWHRGQEAPAGNISWFKDVIQISTPSPVLLAPVRVPRICGLYCHFLHLWTASFASCFLSISHGIWRPTVTRNERVSFLIHLLLFMFSSDQKSPVRSLSHSRFHVHFWDFLSFIQRGSLNMTKMGLVSTVIGHECTLYQIFPWLQFVTDWLTCVTYKPSLKYLSLKKYFTWFQERTWKNYIKSRTHLLNEFWPQ